MALRTPEDDLSVAASAAELMAPENPALAELSGRLDEPRKVALAAYNAWIEAKLRVLLEQWVSEIPPSVAFGRDGELLGLCDANAPLGSKPFIFTGMRKERDEVRWLE